MEALVPHFMSDAPRPQTAPSAIAGPRPMRPGFVLADWEDVDMAVHAPDGRPVPLPSATARTFGMCPCGAMICAIDALGLQGSQRGIWWHAGVAGWVGRRFGEESH